MITIKISTTINAPLEKVWTCYTTPKHITQWNFASEEWQCPHAENNLQKNGTFNYRMEAKDGSMGFDFTGTYNEIIEHQLINYSLDDRRKVQTTFNQTKDGIEVKTTFEAENQHSAEMQKNGWQAILNNFKKYTENLKL